MRAEAVSVGTDAATVVAGRLPAVVEPMLPVRVPEPFDSSGHIFEVLWEGVRALLFVEGGRVRVQDRWGSDVTERFPELAAARDATPADGLVIDGQIVCLDSDGRPDFRMLASRLDSAPEIDGPPVTFQAFDLLYREGQPLTGWPLRRRKEMLRALVRDGHGLNVPDWVARDGIAFFEAARRHGLRGIVAKEVEGTYSPGERRRTWLKIPIYDRDQFVVGGYIYGGRWTPRTRRGHHAEPGLSLLVGRFERDGLRFEGVVPVELADGATLMQRLDGMAGGCPFPEAPQVAGLVTWCRPDLVVSVRYGEIGTDGRLRFPVLDALRPDVPAGSCVADDDSDVR